MFRYHYVYDLEHLEGYILYFWRLEFSGETSFTEMCDVLLRSKDGVFVQQLCLRCCVQSFLITTLSSKAFGSDNNNQEIE